MRYDEYFEKICNSTMDDWNYDDESGFYFYKYDIDILIENDISWLENSDDCCYDDWANKSFESRAYRKRFILKYRDNIVKKIYGVFVDGCKCFIPEPNENMIITKEQYAVGKIINGFINSIEKFDFYLNKVSIKINSE